jgi:hypothetical protein
MQDGQVGPDDDMLPELTRRADEATEVRVQFRRSSCDIEGDDRIARQHREDRVDGISVHGLRPAGAGIDVAVRTRQIAAVSHIDLEGRDALSGERFAAEGAHGLVERAPGERPRLEDDHRDFELLSLEGNAVQ